jgi:hypothetical protein
MTAFTAAMAALLADPHLGAAALYRQGGGGPAVPVRVLRSSPDRVAGTFDTSLLQAPDVLAVAIAALPDLAPSDSFALGDELLTVTQAERDATGTAWRVLCQR